MFLHKFYLVRFFPITQRPPSDRDDHGRNILMVFFLFLVLLMSCWDVAALLVAEQTNAGVAVCVADITSRCTSRLEVDGVNCCPPFCVLTCPLLQSSVYFPLASNGVSGHSSTVCSMRQ